MLISNIVTLRRILRFIFVVYHINFKQVSEFWFWQVVKIFNFEFVLNEFLWRWNAIVLVYSDALY